MRFMCATTCLLLFLAVLPTDPVEGNAKLVAPAESIVGSTCPDVPGVDDFNITEFLGTWYIIKRPIDSPLLCYVIHVLWNETDDNYSVVSSFVHPRTKEIVRFTSAMEIGGDKGALITLTSGDDTVIPGVTDYLVIGIDYDEYATLNTCISNVTGNYHTVYPKVLSRTPIMSKEVNTNAMRHLNRNRICKTNMVRRNFRRCPAGYDKL